jgi:hypothetical protein
MKHSRWHAAWTAEVQREIPGKADSETLDLWMPSMSRGDLNIVHEHPCLRTRRIAHEPHARSVHERETVTTQSHTTHTVNRSRIVRNRVLSLCASRHHIGTCCVYKQFIKRDVRCQKGPWPLTKRARRLMSSRTACRSRLFVNVSFSLTFRSLLVVCRLAVNTSHGALAPAAANLIRIVPTNCMFTHRCLISPLLLDSSTPALISDARSKPDIGPQKNA